MIQLKTITCSASIVIFLICLCSIDGYVNEKLERKYHSSQGSRVEFFENYNRHFNRKETKSKDDGRVAEKLYDRRSFRTGTPSETKFIYTETYIGNSKDRKTDFTNITSKRNNHITHYRRDTDYSTRTRDTEYIIHIPQVRKKSYEYDSITNNRRYRNTQQNRQLISRSRKFRNIDRKYTETIERDTERRNQRNENYFNHRKSRPNLSEANVETKDIILKNAKMIRQRKSIQHTNRRKVFERIEHKIPLFKSPYRITRVVDIRTVKYLPELTRDIKYLYSKNMLSRNNNEVSFLTEPFIINSEPLDNIILDDSKSHSTLIREIKDRRTQKIRRSDRQYSFTRLDEARKIPQNYFFRTETPKQADSNRQNNLYLIERRQSISERSNEISINGRMQTNEKHKRLAITNIRRSQIVRNKLEDPFSSINDRRLQAKNGRNLRNIHKKSIIHMQRREGRNIGNNNSIGRFVADGYHRQSRESRRIIGSSKLIRDTSKQIPEKNIFESKFIDNTLGFASKGKRYKSVSDRRQNNLIPNIFTSRDMIKSNFKKVPVLKRSLKSMSSTNNERRTVEGNFSTTINQNLFEQRRKEELPDNTIADLVYRHGTFSSTALANTLKLILGFFLLCQIFINSSNKNKSRLTYMITAMKPLNSIKEKVQ